MKRVLRIGTRGSKLAVTQTEGVRKLLEQAYADRSFEITLIQTKGDQVLDRSFEKIGEKGIFVKELDDALLRGDIDCAVHSLKDLPSTLAEGLKLSAILGVVDGRDVLLARENQTLKTLPTGATVGTSSLRRTALLRRLRSDLQVKMLRGNLDTRIRKLQEGQYDAIVVAAAGVHRLGLETHIKEYLDPREFIPAVGQGALAIVGRANDSNMNQLLSAVDDSERRMIIEAERALMVRLEGGCQVPFGCFGEGEGDSVRFIAFVALPDASVEIRRTVEGPKSQATELCLRLADEILGQGGRDVLDRLRGAGSS